MGNFTEFLPHDGEKKLSSDILAVVSQLSHAQIIHLQYVMTSIGRTKVVLLKVDQNSSAFMEPINRMETE